MTTRWSSSALLRLYPVGTRFLFTAFVLCVVGANFFIAHVGNEQPGGLHTIPVGFGLQAPSGVVFVGVSLSLRDSLQDLGGARSTVVAILVGALISSVINPQVAIASGVTFLVSELADFAVYTPLRRTHLAWAIVTSNIVGAAVDSVLFLALAFGAARVSQYAFAQVIGKFEWSVVAMPYVLRTARLKRVRTSRAANG
jgi:queuosine precursor transporter